MMARSSVSIKVEVSTILRSQSCRGSPGEQQGSECSACGVTMMCSVPA